MKLPERSFLVAAPLAAEDLLTTFPQPNESYELEKLVEKLEKFSVLQMKLEEIHLLPHCTLRTSMPDPCCELASEPGPRRTLEGLGEASAVEPSTQAWS